MIVDTHAHYLPQAMLDDLNNRSSDFPNIDCLNQDNIWKLGFSGGPLTRPILPGLRQSDTRLQWMDDQKIDAMVCGGWLDSFGYEIPDEEGKRWSQFINEHLMTACAKTNRFAPLCSVPLQNGKMAAEVLEEALDAGFHGAMIGTQPTYDQYSWTWSLASLIAMNAIALYTLSARVSSMEVTRE